MFNQKKITAIIPVRLNSKEIKYKNIKLLCGMPLIAWTIKAALGSKSIGEVIVNTESNEIAEIAISYGAKVPFIRDKALATDTAYSIDVIRDTINKLDLEGNIMMLQATSPLRDSKDIDDMYFQMIKQKSLSAVSVKISSDLPSWQYFKTSNGNLEPLLKKQSKLRQEEKKYYTLNGAQYLASSEQILKDGFINKHTMPYVMNLKKSIDIDNEFEWELAKYFLEKQNINPLSKSLETQKNNIKKPYLKINNITDAARVL